MSGAPGETLYTFRNQSKVVLQRARANLTSLAAYVDGAVAAPTGASTYTLNGPDGTALVGAQAVTVTASIATYNVLAATLPATLGLGLGYQEIWDLVMPDGLTYKVRRMAVLGLYQLFPPVTELDLNAGEYPDLVTSLGSNGSVRLQGLMDGSWHQCMRYLERHGSWPDIVVDSNDVFDWYRHEVLKRAFGAMLMKQPTERWQSLFEEHRDSALAARQGLRITVDRNRDGTPDNHGKEAISRSLVPNIPPTRRTTNRKF